MNTLEASLDLQPVQGIDPNWRIQFYDVDGLPLSMVSFERIDFGAISYKEIFQNVKTILATPIFSAPLERTLGVDASIVDLPIGRAAEATVAILDALYFWEQRVQVVNIDFESDVLSGHLRVKLQLKIDNVVYGTDQAYEKTSIYAPEPEEIVSQGPTGPPGPPGKDGAQGPRGSYWFTGTTDPAPGSVTPMPPPIGIPKVMDMYLNTTSGDVFQFQAVTPVITPEGQVVEAVWKKVFKR